jgi:hypothetical protein
MAQEFTQLLTKISTRNVPESKERPARKVENLTAICEPIVCTVWDLDISQPCEPPWPVTGISLLSHGSVVGIATGYGLENRGVGVQVSVASRILTSPYHPDRLLCPPIFLSNGYRWVVPRG